jgi:hypothetical protein
LELKICAFLILTLDAIKWSGSQFRHFFIWTGWQRKQERQYTYYATLRHVHETIVVVRVLAYVYVCMCVCDCVRVALLILHATRRRIVISSIWLHHIFRYYLINGTILGKKVSGHEMCIWFSVQRFLNISFLKTIQRDIVIHVKTSSRKVPVIFVGL